MRPIVITRALATADPDGIATSQTPLAGGPLTLDGVFASGGVATLDAQRQVLLTFALNEAARTFVITGTDSQGRVISETVAGAAATSVSVLNYLTVTEVTIDAASAGAITVGTNGVGASQEIPLDQYISPFNVSLGIAVAGTVDVTVQFTIEDVFSGAPGPFTWFNHATLVNVVADGNGTIISPVSACRLLTNSGAGSAILTAAQAGLV